MNPNFDIEKVAQAIEADAGQELPDIRAALAEVKDWMAGRAITPQQILADQDRADIEAVRLQSLGRVIN